MIPTSVYLAGPMSGLSIAEMNTWRQATTDYLLGFHPDVTILSPLRGKEPYIRAAAEESGILDQHTLPNPFSTGKAVMGRDHHDVLMAQVILVNLLGAKKVSIGTSVEIAWAYTHHKPVVAAIEPEGNIHDHPMLTEAFTYRLPNIAQAALTTAILLNIAS